MNPVRLHWKFNKWANNCLCTSTGSTSHLGTTVLVHWQSISLYCNMLNMFQSSDICLRTATHPTDFCTTYRCLNLLIISPLENLQSSYKTQMQSYHSLYVQLLTKQVFNAWLGLLEAVIRQISQPHIQNKRFLQTLLSCYTTNYKHHNAFCRHQLIMLKSNLERV